MLGQGAETQHREEEVEGRVNKYVAKMTQVGRCRWVELGGALGDRGGSGREWEGVGGSGREWEGVGGSGREWEGMGGSGRGIEEMATAESERVG